MTPNPTRLDGLRILLTQADVFMGPALQRVLGAAGAEVIADRRDMSEPDAPALAVADAGPIDVLVAHLAVPAPSTAAQEVTDEEWRSMFAALVDPLPRLCRAVLPAMLARGRGKIILIGSAAALRGQRRTSSYSAARGAQLAYVQALGVEVAAKGIQVNAIAQNLVDNPTYFPPQVQSDPRFKERLRREVPLGRLVSADEDAWFVAHLCSPAADCFVGQVFPLCGGWVTR